MALFSVCFVCTGNICRSPVAEAVFRAHAADAGLDGRISAGSAGTGGWHEGEPADPRAMRTLESAGYELDHTARRFEPEWFDELDLVIALDEGHRRALRAMARTPQDAAKIHLLRAYDPAVADAADHDPADHDPDARDSDARDSDVAGAPGRGHRHGLDVPDPYYGGEDGFDEVLRLVEAAVPGLLGRIARTLDGASAAGSASGSLPASASGSVSASASGSVSGSAALGERTV